MGQDQTVEKVRQGEDQMEVSHRQKLGALLLKPVGLGQRLAFGAVAVTAGVVARMLKAASVTLLKMTSQLSRATDRNGPHDLSVRARQAMRLTVIFPVLAKNIGQLGMLFVDSCFPPPIGRQHEKTRRLSVRKSQQVQRIGRGGELLPADLQITLRADQRVMTQKSLNGSQVHPGFQ